MGHVFYKIYFLFKRYFDIYSFVVYILLFLYVIKNSIIIYMIKLQLLLLLDPTKINDKYLLKIYYFCCLIGGGESIDYYIHKLCKYISQSIKLNLNYYYYKKFNFDILLKTTKVNKKFYTKEEILKFNNFIKKIKNNNIKNKFNNNDKKTINFFENSISLRGFNQIINFNKIYQGNLYKYGRVNNYFINFKDIDILLKLREIYKNKYETAIQCYLQIFQIFHPLNIFFYNHSLLLLEKKICINYKDYNKNCRSRSKNYKTNISVCLQNYGDCREINFIKNIYLLIDQFINFMNYFNNNNFNKMKEIINIHYRLFSLKFYINGKFEKPFQFVKQYFYNNEVLDETKLNEYESNYVKILNNKKMIQVENHVIVLEYNITNNNIISHDMLYKKNNLQFNEKNDYEMLFIADYYLNKINVKYNDTYFDFGQNYFNDKVYQYAIFDYNYFKNIKIQKNKKYKLTYLNDSFKFNKNFYKINDFILWREKYMYYNRIKYFNYKYKTSRYIKDNKSYKLFYFFIEDYNE
jgi:hypothetical protein